GSGTQRVRTEILRPDPDLQQLPAGRRAPRRLPALAAAGGAGPVDPAQGQRAEELFAQGSAAPAVQTLSRRRSQSAPLTRLMPASTRALPITKPGVSGSSRISTPNSTPNSGVMNDRTASCEAR